MGISDGDWSAGVGVVFTGSSFASSSLPEGAGTLIQIAQLWLPFLLGGAAYCLIFPNLTYQHEYALICLWGPLSLGAAAGGRALLAVIKNSVVRGFLTAAVCMLLLAQSVSVKAGQRKSERISLWERDLGRLLHANVPSEEAAMTSAPVSFAAKYYSDRFVRFEVRELPDFLDLLNAGDHRYRCYVRGAGDPIAAEPQPPLSIPTRLGFRSLRVRR